PPNSQAARPGARHGPLGGPDAAQEAPAPADRWPFFTLSRFSRATKRRTGRTLGTAGQPVMRTGLLLINLGTPDAPTTPAVRRYLREFLGDPRVLDIGPVGRALLLNLIILPTRPRKSAHAYASIWDARRGSPLLYHSRDLAAAVAGQLGPARPVELPMRYRSPSLAAPLDPPPQAP